MWWWTSNPSLGSAPIVQNVNFLIHPWNFLPQVILCPVHWHRISSAIMNDLSQAQLLQYQKRSQNRSKTLKQLRAQRRKHLHAKKVLDETISAIDVCPVGLCLKMFALKLTGFYVTLDTCQKSSCRWPSENQKPCNRKSRFTNPRCKDLWWRLWSH